MVFHYFKKFFQNLLMNFSFLSLSKKIKQNSSFLNVYFGGATFLLYIYIEGGTENLSTHHTSHNLSLNEQTLE